MNLEEKLDQQINELEKEIEYLKKVKQLLAKFPDLKERTDRWGNKYYSSSQINEQVDNVYFKHSCGCCPDAPLLAFFYKEIDGVKIYADPYSICVGEQNPNGFGDFPNKNWRETLAEYRIPKSMEEKVEAYFREHPPENFDDDEDEF